MTDIQTRADVESLVQLFYHRLLDDELLGPIFHQTILNNLKEHLSVITRFWSSVLLNEQSYTGNVMLKHLSLNQKIPLKEKHFMRWMNIWEETVSELFEGKLASEAIYRAGLMKELMIYKIKRSEGGNFIQ